MSILNKVLIIVLSMFMIVACSNEKPSNADVENAVEIEMQKGVPERWMKAMLQGKEPNLERVAIVEWGKFNENQKSWPIKVRVIGRATLVIPYARSSEVRSFDEVGHFNFYKDDFDKWQWEFKRPGLFGD